MKKTIIIILIGVLMLVGFSQAALYQNYCWSLTNGLSCINGTTGNNTLQNLKLNWSDILNPQAGGSMSSWIVSNGSVTEVITDGEQVNFTNGTGILISQTGGILKISATGSGDTNETLRVDSLIASNVTTNARIDSLNTTKLDVVDFTAQNSSYFTLFWLYASAVIQNTSYYNTFLTGTANTCQSGNYSRFNGTGFECFNDLQGAGSSDGNNYTTNIIFQGTTTKTLNLTRNDGTILQASFTDINTDTNDTGLYIPIGQANAWQLVENNITDLTHTVDTNDTGLYTPIGTTNAWIITASNVSDPESFANSHSHNTLNLTNIAGLNDAITLTEANITDLTHTVDTNDTGLYVPVTGGNFTGNVTSDVDFCVGLKCLSGTGVASGDVTGVSAGVGINVTSPGGPVPVVALNISYTNTLYVGITNFGVQNSSYFTLFWSYANAVIQNTSTWAGIDSKLAISDAITTYVNRSLWTTIDNYPSACSGTQAVRGIGDTLSCFTLTNSLELTENNISDLVHTTDTNDTGLYVPVGQANSWQLVENNITDLTHTVDTNDTGLYTLPGTANAWVITENNISDLTHTTDTNDTGLYVPITGGEFTGNVTFDTINVTAIYFKQGSCIIENSTSITTYSNGTCP